MLINSSLQQNAPSFGKLKCYTGATKILKKNLKASQAEALEKLIQKQESNGVNVNIFAKYKSNRRLEANVVTRPNTKNLEVTNYTQRLWESSFGFIKRCCKQADKFNEEISKNKR